MSDAVGLDNVAVELPKPFSKADMIRLILNKVIDEYEAPLLIDRVLTQSVALIASIVGKPDTVSEDPDTVLGHVLTRSVDLFAAIVGKPGSPADTTYDKVDTVLAQASALVAAIITESKPGVDTTYDNVDTLLTQSAALIAAITKESKSVPDQNDRDDLPQILENASRLISEIVTPKETWSFSDVAFGAFGKPDYFKDSDKKSVDINEYINKNKNKINTRISGNTIATTSATGITHEFWTTAT
jgi:hypothetical protein